MQVRGVWVQCAERGRHRRSEQPEPQPSHSHSHSHVQASAWLPGCRSSGALSACLPHATASTAGQTAGRAGSSAPAHLRRCPTPPSRCAAGTKARCRQKSQSPARSERHECRQAGRQADQRVSDFGTDSRCQRTVQHVIHRCSDVRDSKLRMHSKRAGYVRDVRAMLHARWSSALALPDPPLLPPAQ